MASRLPWARREDSCTCVVLPGGTLWSHRPRAGGLTLTCNEGWIWLTQEGDTEDHVLAAGSSLRLDKPGLVVVQALRSARFCVCQKPRGQVGTPPAMNWAAR
ncbi:DUF2917 domain-containing protein [Hyalangium rubrum]|uniref:DUF2917 domain-containing protein n=1 Tax=Hyalangium rubrum TaxID=3103134 RepID=A0ABU5H9F5_9BACT|nr:DUF2917 domain-containing protein [Hyalangium sp. s54d21]MDY7230108.1 DUF2917 domain-containing protein [Hyalangium sp. s54d21]